MNKNEKSIKKIAIVGPESTGKSTMAKHLSEYFNTLCVPEYSRYYCQNLNKNYTLEDEVNMFYGQLALEDAIIDQAKTEIVFCDTTIITVKIWCDHLFNNTPEFILSEIRKKNYDLYLLMDIDLPWQDDPLRDFPNQREHFLEIWKKELKSIKASYKVISGLGQDRLKNGVQTIEDFLKKP